MKNPTQSTEDTQSKNPKCACVDCKCDPCECSDKSCCSKSGASCSSSWCTWGAALRIAIAVLLIVGAFGVGVRIGAEKGDRYDHFRDRDGRDEMRDEMRDERGTMWQMPMNCPMMQGAMTGGMMNMTGSHDMMDMSMHDMGKMLKWKTGAELNKAFLEGMIPHHQAAVDMAAFLAASDKPELVKLGWEIITTQTKEIEQMKKWLIEWGYTQAESTHTGVMNMHVMPDGTIMQN